MSKYSILSKSDQTLYQILEAFSNPLLWIQGYFFDILGRSLSQTRFQDPWSLLGWQIRIWHHWSQKDLVFRSRHLGTQHCYWRHQGSPILEWNQGLCYCWFPMGFKRGMFSFLISVDFFILKLHFSSQYSSNCKRICEFFFVNR